MKKDVIKATKSPYDEDAVSPTNPWWYTVEGFLEWYDEVFREGYKRPRGRLPSTDIDVSEAMDALIDMGYEIEWADSSDVEGFIVYSVGKDDGRPS
jgi:hypothetical protein